jgi:hypothetical protein
LELPTLLVGLERPAAGAEGGQLIVLALRLPLLLLAEGQGLPLAQALHCLAALRGLHQLLAVPFFGLPQAVQAGLCGADVLLQLLEATAEAGKQLRPTFGGRAAQLRRPLPPQALQAGQEPLLLLTPLTAQQKLPLRQVILAAA